ncbi:MAG TPA: hypothetical protein VJT10_23480 [Steroidobacteraceae bacterium]|nr:hypothetical protein [Steroidobacteraceae bacterium]
MPGSGTAICAALTVSEPNWKFVLVLLDCTHSPSTQVSTLCVNKPNRVPIGMLSTSSGSKPLLRSMSPSGLVSVSDHPSVSERVSNTPVSSGAKIRGKFVDPWKTTT